MTMNNYMKWMGTYICLEWMDSWINGVILKGLCYKYVKYIHNTLFGIAM